MRHPLAFLVLALAVSARAERTAPQVFEGAYLVGFEASQMRPGKVCGDRSILYWVEAEPGAGFAEAFEKAGGRTPEGSRGEVRAYRVRFEGRLSEPGHYGHLGRFTRQLTVSRVVSVTLAPDCLARW